MNTLEIAQGKRVNQTYESHAQVKDLLNLLHDYYALSWPEIARLPELCPPGEPEIPFSTLAKIAKTGRIPQKWRYRFPGSGPIDNRPRTSIHKKNMQSTAQTIKNQIEPEDRAELIKLLADDPQLPIIVLIWNK